MYQTHPEVDFVRFLYGFSLALLCKFHQVPQQMAPAWPRADKEAQDGHEPRHIRARDIGIIIGCVVAIMILAHVV